MYSFGVLGHPLGHTLSPVLHNLIYAETGTRAAYNRFDVPPERVGKVVESLRVLGIKGINVTIPYKQTILEQLDALSPEAEKIGAVNTVDIAEDGKATGYNTDYYGFLTMLRRACVDIAGKRFLICGMSGAGKAIRQALEDNGAEVLVASTDPAKGVPYDSLATLEGYDTIVNCTPVGMSPKVDVSVVGPEVLRRFTTAVDIVYNPRDTLFLKTAKELGLQTVGGLPMLVYQGIKSFEIWTGKEVRFPSEERILNNLSGRFL